MLKLFDKSHNAIGNLVKYRDCRIESELSAGDKTLYFTCLEKELRLETEMYVRTREDEYVIKEVPGTTGSFPQIVAVLNLEELQQEVWQTFSVKDTTITEAARIVLAGTGWTVGQCDVKKRRNAGMIQVSALEVIQKLCTAFMCEPVFDTLNKKVSFYAQRGEDRGVYFMSGLNLKKLQKKCTSYDYYTRIIPIGANGLTIESVNGGRNYLENFKYSSKRLTCIWKEESYTDPQALKEDAEKKLDNLSQPEKSYQADVWDLARQKPEYSVLSYRLGDTVQLIDRETGTLERQRIVKLTEYPQNPEKNTCELANTVLTFEEMQRKAQAAAEIIEYTIAGDGRYTGTINVSDILHFEEGISESGTVGGIQSSIATMQGELADVKLTLGSIETNYLKAEEADLKFASVEELKVTNESVHSIQGDYAEFKTATAEELLSQNGRIENLSGQFSSYQIQMARELVAAKGWMAESSIGSAQIQDLDVNKLNAGTVDTARISLASPDSALQINGSRILVNDTADPLNPMNRVTLGKYTDTSGNTEYGLLVRSADGQTVMIDGIGVHNAGITEGAIDDSKVAEDAGISGKKLDIQSVVTEINAGGTKLSQTIIQVGDKSLDVVLRERTQEINSTAERFEERFSDHEAKISSNEAAIRLRVSQADFESYRTAVSGELSSAKSRLNKAEAGIDVMEGQIALKVEQTDIDEAVSDVSGKVEALETWRAEASQKITKDGIVATVGNYYATDAAMETVRTTAAQTAEKFSWIVKTGTGASGFTLTDRTASLVAETVSLNGSVKVSKDMLVDGAVTAAKIAADAIKSRNYAYSSGTYASAGTFFDLSTGLLRSKSFAIDAAGNAYFKGHLNGATGSFSGDVEAESFVAKERIRLKKVAFHGGEAVDFVVCDASMKADTFHIGNGTVGIWLDGRVQANAITLASDVSAAAAVTAGTNITAGAHLFTGGKTAAQDGVRGACVSSNAGIFLTGDAAYSPRILFLCNGATDLQAQILSPSANKLKIYAPSGFELNASSGVTNLTSSSLAVKTNGAITLNNGKYLVGMFGGETSFRTAIDADGKVNLGISNARWMKVYAANGTIGTSDERDKDILGAVDERYLRLYMALKPVLYRWKDRDIDEKIHIGLGAQTTERSAAACGIAASGMGMIEHDFWSQPSGDGRTDRYGMNYQEVAVLTVPVVQEHERRLEECGSRIASMQSREASFQYQLAQAYDRIARLEKQVDVLRKAV